jgi:anti-sigma regulatory factor (Ser/Thr protein kinase)
MQLSPVPSSATAARRSLDIFSDWLPGPAFADLRVVVTELVTNAVKYGPGAAIDLYVGLHPGGHLRGEVDDGGSGGVRIRPPGPVGGGLGLVIVEALTSAWGVHPDSSHVWFEFEMALA